jgi:hypothetical protein
MKDFFQKNKKLLIIILIVLLLLITGTLLYIFVFKDMLNGDTDTQNTDVSQEQESNTTTPVPEFVLSSSAEAIEAMYKSGQEWSDDIEIYDCSGIPTTVTYPDIEYPYVGASDGEYSAWMCTFYSPSKAETRLYEYKNGALEEPTEAMDIGEYGYLLYGDINYPDGYAKLADSSDIYVDALEQGLDDEANYVNMYLWDTSDYGFVWQLEERSRTQQDEYEIGVIVNTYIYDRYTGQLKDIVQEEVY